MLFCNLRKITISDPNPQLWHVALLGMLAVPPGLARKQRVTLRRDGRDVEVKSGIGLNFTFLVSIFLHFHIVDIEVEGGVDFSLATRDPESGKLCVLEEKEVDTMLKKPILECTHRWAKIKQSNF